MSYPSKSGWSRRSRPYYTRRLLPPCYLRMDRSQESTAESRASVASAEPMCVLEGNVPAKRPRAESRGLTWARSIRGGGTTGDGLAIDDGVLAGRGASLPLDAGGAEGSRTPDPLYAKQVLYH